MEIKSYLIFIFKDFVMVEWRRVGGKMFFSRKVKVISEISFEESVIAGMQGKLKKCR